MGKLLARGVQLLEKPLEPTADASQRGGALFLQFLEKALVLGPRVLDAHGDILIAVNGGYGVNGSTRRNGVTET